MTKPNQQHRPAKHLSTAQLAAIVGGDAQFKGNVDMARAAPPVGVPSLA